MGKEGEFLEACRDGNLSKAQQILFGKTRKLSFSLSKNGLPLTQYKETDTGSTALHYASLNGHKGVVDFLLKNKADVRLSDAQGCLPLHLASWNGHSDIVQRLLDYDQTTPCSTANVVNKAREIPLHYAAQYGHNEVARILIRYESDPTIRNIKEESPLDLAAKNGRKEIVELLILAHPQLIFNSYSNNTVTTTNGCNADRSLVTSPLHLASKNGKTEVVRILLDAGFDINLLTEEGTALHSSALYGKIDVVKLLLGKGINIDAKDFNGRTVLNLLEEHRTRKSGTLSDSLKHLDIWQNCASLIENVRQKDKQSLSPVARQISTSVYENGDAENRAPATATPIWMSLPPDCAARLLSEKSTRDASTKSLMLPSNATKLLSVKTDLTTSLHSNSNDELGSICSTISLTPDVSPLTSPGATLERGGVNSKPKKQPRRNVVCTYQPSPLISSGYDNVPSMSPTPAVYPSGSAYDNVPSNVVGYDNAPPPGQKAWAHVCGGDDCSHEDHNNGGDRETFVSPQRSPENTNGPGRPEHVDIASQYGRIELINLSPSPPSKSSPKPRVTWVGNYDNVPETVVPQQAPTPSKHLAPPMITVSTITHEQSANNNSNADRAAIYKTIEMIERSSSEIEECVRSDSLTRSSKSATPPPRVLSPSLQSSSNFDTASLSRGLTECDSSNRCSTSSSLKAPLAQFDTEDLGTSAEGDVFVYDGTDARCTCKSPTSPSQLPPVKTPSEPPPSVFDSESKICRKIRPLSDEYLLQQCSTTFSVSTSTTATPSPINKSRLLNKSPSKHRSLVDGETQVDSTIGGSSECCNSSECSSCSEGSRCSLAATSGNNRHSNDIIVADDSAGVQFSSSQKCAQTVTPKNTPTTDVVSPIDEQAEWKKIDEIFQSYGSAMSRLSIFESDVEPAFSTYLKHATNGTLPGNRNESNNNPSPKQRSVERWLTSIGLNCYVKLFYGNGFDRLEFLKYTVDLHVLHYIGVLNGVDCDQILKSILNLPSASWASCSASNFRYPSDWLHALGCQDDLVYFARRGIDSMQRIINFTESDLLNIIGIPLFGHRRRLSWSIANAVLSPLSSPTSVSSSVNSNNNNNNNASTGYVVQDSATINSNNSLSNATHDGEEDTSSSSGPVRWLHSPDALTGTGINYVAHYLGSTEICDDKVYGENLELEEIKRTELTRKAICELKEKMRDSAKIPEVVLQIRFKGVCLLDAKSQHLLCEHLVQNIHCVCQDERDMNCFAYNTKDGNHHFCHVFSVFTSDLAREIILSLGQAFEVAYQKALETGRI